MDDLVTIDYSRIAGELQLQESQVAATIALLDEGNTIPFLTRYRKEQTGQLDEVQLRAVQERVRVQRQITERAATILRLLETQGHLTEELRSQILQATSLKHLEDLYLPFRPKRLTRAEIARRQGLEEFARKIWDRDVKVVDLRAEAEQYLSPENNVASVDDVLRGVRDLLAERISEDLTVRNELRKTARQTGKFHVTASKKEVDAAGQAFRDYFDYSERVTQIPPHRALAINRGERLGVLRIKWVWDDAEAVTTIERCLDVSQDRFAEFLRQCVREALSRLLVPSLEREFRRELTERAQSQAVKVFTENLRKLLLQPPVRGRRVLAIDPGYRTGCKIAVLDENGMCRANDVIYVTGSSERQLVAKSRLAEFIKTHGVQLVAIGNGTACRETEELVSDMIAEHCPDVRYLIVNEAGASIYSASPIAREEFPDFDATVRGTISLGRRLLDPLSELVKIDPEHLGIGMYQHDIDPKLLRSSLDDVIESCVNYVGVDLNTASAPLLKYVSGLNQVLAQRIVAWRNEHGRFQTREQLREVAGVGETRFTQAAGFLKIVDGAEPLDRTWIHPESYHVVKDLFSKLSEGEESVKTCRINEVQMQALTLDEKQRLADELKIGMPTLTDILESLARPGRDPRVDLPKPFFKKGILKLSDVSIGMELKGTVLNVVDFGVFVDIGLKDSALVHISQLSTDYVRSPHEVVSVGNVISVWVLEIDPDRRRVSLTMIPPGYDRQKKPTAQPSVPVEATEQERHGKRSDRPVKNVRVDKPTTQSTASDEGALPPDAAGKTLRGFDELKQLWQKKQR